MMRYTRMIRILVVTLFHMRICVTVLKADFQNAYFSGTNTYSDLLPTEGILRSMATHSLIECGLDCLGDPRCPAFFHDGRKCCTYSKNMDDLVSTVPTQNMMYYEQKGMSVNSSATEATPVGSGCGAPPTEEGVTWEPGTTHLGSVRQYTCRVDLIPTADEIQCLTNGSWSQQSGFCRTLRVKQVRIINIHTAWEDNDCLSPGVVYFPDGRIVVADIHNHKLKLLTDGGQYLDELEVRGDPHDMCLVDNNTVAVAVRNPGCVRVVNVGSSNLALAKEIDNDMDCYGIAYTDGVFVVGDTFAFLGTGVFRVAENGTADLLQVYSARSDSIASDPTNQGQVLVTFYTDADVVVSRLSVASKQATVVQNAGILIKSKGIDVDAEGNIYVLSHSSNKVFRMSPDGTYVKELLSFSDGIKRPHAIAVSGNQFAITFAASERANDIRIYQLY